MTFKKYIITGKLRKKNNRIIKQTIPPNAEIQTASGGILRGEKRFARGIILKKYEIYSAMLTEK